MKVSTRCEYFLKRYGETEGIRLLGKAGFEVLDFGMSTYPYDYPLYTADENTFTEHYKELKKKIDSFGMSVFQAHACVPSYVNDEVKDAEIFKTLCRNIQATALLGCDKIVIHPRIPHEYKYDHYRAETREINLAFYSALVPYLKEYGVTCLIENMFNYDSEKQCICPTVCSYSEEMIDYIDMVDNRYFAACLDIGHGNLTPESPVDMIRNLGKRIKALHIHDNNGISDQHLSPYLGTVNWDDITSALSEIGYNGTFNLEAEKIYNNPFFAADPVATAHQMFLVATDLAKKIKN